MKRGPDGRLAKQDYVVFYDEDQRVRFFPEYLADKDFVPISIDEMQKDRELLRLRGMVIGRIFLYDIELAEVPIDLIHACSGIVDLGSNMMLLKAFGKIKDEKTYHQYKAIKALMQ